MGAGHESGGLKMDGEFLDNDIVEMDFPAYAEDDHAIPDVPPEASFAENKEEIYRRNRLLAADMQAKELAVIAEEEKAIAAKAAKIEELYKESAAAENYSRSMKIIFAVLAVMFAVVIAVVAILSMQMLGSFKNVSVSPDAVEIVPVETLSEKAVSAVTEVPKEKAEVSEKKEVTIITIDTSPLVEEEGTFVYNAEKISYRFSPYYGTDDEGKTVLYVDVTAKRLEDAAGLYVIPEFSLVDTVNEYSKTGYLYEYEKGPAKYPSGVFYKSVNGRMVQSDPDPEVLGFNKDDLCIFTMGFSIPEGDKHSYDLIRYCPEKGPDKYADKRDKGFDIPASAFPELGLQKVKKPVDTSPLTAEAGTVVYNGVKVSYRFALHYGVNEYGIRVLVFDVTAKKLIDNDDICVVPEFWLQESGSGYKSSGRLVEYNTDLAGYSSPAYKIVDGETVPIEPSPMALFFDEDNVCNFKMHFYVSEDDRHEYDVIVYHPEITFDIYTGNADAGFEISLSDFGVIE